jgi:alkylation response protein AidB-like acyl-CoA dehydrogenase
MSPTSLDVDPSGNSGANHSVACAAQVTNVTNRILADIQSLAPEITRRAMEIDAGRRIPLDLMEELRSIGIFRALVPRSYGGLELDMPAAITIMEALCRIDGSVGWNSMVGMGSAIFAPLAPREVLEQIYAKGPDIFFAGSVQPAGTAEAVDGGWRVSGRWPLASGCQDADWIFVLCIMSKDGKPLPGPMGEHGPPMMRGFLLPVREWQIEDTWYAVGLKGTGSHHISLQDKVIPADKFFDLPGDDNVIPADKFFDLSGEPRLPGPLYEAVPQLVPLMHIPAATGVAAGALDDLVQLANSGRQQQRTDAPMRDLEIFQYELGRVEADLRAVRAFADAQIESHWRHALAGTLKGDALLAQGTQAATWITAACVRIVNDCFRLGGGSALYDSSPLQRRMRDLHAAAQHVLVNQRNYADSGKLLLISADHAA